MVIFAFVGHMNKRERELRSKPSFPVKVRLVSSSYTYVHIYTPYLVTPTRKMDTETSEREIQRSREKKKDYC